MCCFLLDFFLWEIWCNFQSLSSLGKVLFLSHFFWDLPLVFRSCLLCIVAWICRGVSSLGQSHAWICRFVSCAKYGDIICHYYFQHFLNPASFLLSLQNSRDIIVRSFLLSHKSFISVLFFFSPVYFFSLLFRLGIFNGSVFQLMSFLFCSFHFFLFRPLLDLFQLLYILVLKL